MQNKEKRERLVQCLEEHNASCLLPLLDLVENLDNLVDVGIINYVRPNENLIAITEGQINDLGHERELRQSEMTDEEILENSKMDGGLRVFRRKLKEEGNFLSKKSTINQFNGFCEMLRKAEAEKMALEETKYFTREIKLDIENHPRMTNGNSASLRLDEISIEKPIVEKTKLKPAIEDEGNLIGNMLNTKYTIDDSSDELLQAKNRISNLIRDEVLFENENKMVHWSIALPHDWNKKFNRLPPNKKTKVIVEAYEIFMKDPEEKNKAKAIKDFKVWQYILPKLVYERSLIKY